MDVGGLKRADRDVEDVVEMMLDATRNYDKALTEEPLFGWHASLFPTGRSGMRRTTVGEWRNDSDGPMQVVSGPAGKEKVHFEAPKSAASCRGNDGVSGPVQRRPGVDPVLQSGIAHLWFVTIHPFDDGNARLARDRRSVPRALGKEFPAFLKHVGANPTGAQGLLRPAGTHAKRRDTHNGVSDMVPGMPRPRD
jgi:hypothetical protein